MRTSISRQSRPQVSASEFSFNSSRPHAFPLTIERNWEFRALKISTRQQSIRRRRHDGTEFFSREIRIPLSYLRVAIAIRRLVRRAFTLSSCLHSSAETCRDYQRAAEFLRTRCGCYCCCCRRRVVIVVVLSHQWLFQEAMYMECSFKKPTNQSASQSVSQSNGLAGSRPATVASGAEPYTGDDDDDGDGRCLRPAGVMLNLLLNSFGGNVNVKASLEASQSAAGRQAGRQTGTQAEHSFSLAFREWCLAFSRRTYQLSLSLSSLEPLIGRRTG